ncbi:MAG: NAD-dependent epimerase/dehydratase family protein [Nanoarchaeota archaeon]
MSKPILALTGASGFLGRHLARMLSSDFRIRAISTHPMHFSSVSEVRAGDIRDPTFLQLALKGCNAVVHCAAITNTIDPDLMEVNVNYTHRLVMAAKKARLKNFVYISTENVTYNCKDPYTRSKVEAEKIVLKYFPGALIVRPSLIFGREDKRYLAIFVKAIRKLPIVPVFPESVCTLQPIHVEDVAKLVLQGLKLKKQGVYSLVGCEPCSFAKIGQVLERYLGKRRLFLPIPALMVKLSAFLLGLGSKNMRRLSFLLQNAFVLRHANLKKLEASFHYKLPPFEERLKDLVL